MHSASFDELNNRSFIEKLRNWTCILIACIIMARPSEVREYRPVVESIEIPIERKDWNEDIISKWIKMGLPHWKGKNDLDIWNGS